MKIYQVIYQDEYDNLYHIGFYYHLKDAVPDINKMIKDTGIKLKKSDLKTYPSTFNECFDLDLGSLLDDEELYGQMIRGFIFDQDEILNLNKK